MLVRAGFCFLTSRRCHALRVCRVDPADWAIPETINLDSSYAITVDAGFFFGLCRAVRRPVGADGMAFVSALFGALDASGSVKRGSKRLSR